MKEFSEPAVALIVVLIYTPQDTQQLRAQRITENFDTADSCLALLTVAPISHDLNSRHKFKSHILSKAVRMIANYRRALKDNTP